jgi:hypothetical protein
MHTTTEQVLHPDKYKATEAAKPVVTMPIETLLTQGWRESARGNLGEFTIQNLLVLGLRNDRQRAQRGADGWGGDAWVLYVRGESRLIHFATVWDADDQAREFYETLTESLASRSGVKPPAGERNFGLQLEGYTWRIALAADRVTIVSSTEAAAAEAAAAALGLK